jgi:outer membrane receptor protein involved in Fe transport
MIILLAINNPAQSKGIILGKVIDKSTNEELVGANVLIVGTATGASTDLDGFYSIRNLAPGKYQLRFSYISYQTIFVNNVTVEADKETWINISLIPATTELDEVVVTADALKDSEVSLLKIQRNSINIVDGMSAELIKRNNASDGTDVLAKMTGVTISDGKHAFIRGVGDRYNNTMLNGATVPSTDPEKRSFSYDLIPASIIEQVLTAKTSTPDKPADFSGGLVQIKTVEFPQKFILDISYGSSYTNGSNLGSFNSYNGGGRDFLGYDDGTRSLPKIINEQKVTRGNFSDDGLRNIGQSFSNKWGINPVRSPLNQSFRVALGDRVPLGDDMLGYVSSFTYSNNFDLKEVKRATYNYEGPRFLLDGKTSNNSVFLGGLLNLSYKIGSAHKLSFKNTFNLSSDDETIIYNGNYVSFLQERNRTSLRFVSRTLRSHQLIGEHYLGLLSGLNTEWTLSYSRAGREEPDARTYLYSRATDEADQPLRFVLDQSQVTRFYGSLDDRNFNFSTQHTLKFSEIGEIPAIKFGFLYDDKKRDFNARSFGFRNVPGGNFLREDSVLLGPIEEIFIPENFLNNFIEVVEITKPSDSYSSSQYVTAGFVMFDLSLFNNLKVVTGIRFESSRQNMSSFSQTNQPVNIGREYMDWLPSINLTYILNQNMNIRVAYSTTLARPDFRELAPFSYYDFMDNELVQGNDSLSRTLINNYDFRYEYYPTAGELVALSLYYKKFIAPIEQVFLPASNLDPIRSYQNASSAENFGLEFEIRKSLSFLSSWFEQFSLVGNASIIRSRINIASAGFQEASRPLQGQADYIINTGIYYNNSSSGTSVSLTLNKIGHRIAKVGFGNLGDVIELPRNQVDFSVSQKVFEKFSIRLLIRDLFQEEKKAIQRTPYGDKDYEIVYRNAGISLNIGYQL